ncbi:Hypothetical protein CINCED_3A018416 [Cinara cedri]|uniref:Uncharacterized protein n=1 Tax=Cinara cedri TaxID=506608 RepID=A0A5E4N1Y6_9HEMI|nr:Hypothetical protein CINCED_3A018416 [Cinara cedri]
MEASAPYMNECVNVECKNPFEDYTDVYMITFVQIAQTKFSNIADCRQFVNDYKKNPKSVFNVCHSCLISRKSRWSLNSKSITKTKKETGSWYNAYYICPLIVIIVAFSIGVYVAKFSNTTDLSNANNNNMKFKLINSFKVKFPSLQLTLLKKLASAFSRLNTPGEPFVFLLLHDDSNKITTDCLASFTSILAKENIFTNSKNSLWINASEWTPYSDLDNKDLLFKKLIDPLTENKVLVLENLQDLPWSLANDLHFLCDSENPLIAKAMYILELRVNGGDGLQRLTDREKLETAERAMTTAWADAPNSFRAALISRLTSYVDVVLLQQSDKGCTEFAGYLHLGTDTRFIKISP